MSIYTMPPVVDQYAILNCLMLHLHLVLWKLLLDLSYLVTRIKHSVHYILFILKSIKGVVWLFYIRVSIISIWKNDVQPKISYVFLKRFETRNCLSPYSTPSIYAFWLIIHVFITEIITGFLCNIPWIFSVIFARSWSFYWI